MYLYFFLIWIAALCGHRKARLLIDGLRAQKVLDGKISVLGRQVPHHAVWVHAASVGEFEQARPMIERLRREKPHLKIVLTFFSPSGYEMRKHYDQVDAVLYLPFATRRNAKRFIDTLQPKMAIFVKYEFWPAYLNELHKRAIPTYSICAIFRKQQLFFHWYGKRHLNALRCFTHIYVQDEASRALLAQHGILQSSVAGDTRFDRVVEVKNTRSLENAERLAPIEAFIAGSERVIVGGSTWSEDEKLIAEFIEKANGLRDEKVKLILVPHELTESHLHFIFNLFKGRLVRYTTRNNPQSLRDADVLLIDTMGLLSTVYRFGQVAYIGGGFGVGIHNTIEAAVYGMPVLFGPNYHHFREAKGLIDAGAARSIKNYNELEEALEVALEHYQTIGAKAAEYVASETGATAKIYDEIFAE